MPDFDSSFHKGTPGLSYSTSSTLIVRLREKNHLAWDRVKRLFGRLVLNWCRQFPHLQRSDRQDIFQDVFLTAFQKIEQFHKVKEHQSFRGWLRSITFSRIADHARKMKKEPQLLSDTRMELLGKRLLVLPPQEEAEEESERIILYRQALEMIRNDFEPRTWEAFVRITMGQGITSRQVGEELGMSPEAVRQAKSKILKRLREEFGDVLSK